MWFDRAAISTPSVTERHRLALEVRDGIASHTVPRADFPRRKGLLRSGQRAMLPEEKELARLEGEQAELKERVSAAVVRTGNNQNGTARFQSRLYYAVGPIIRAVGRT
jgi:hypothetical protein